tara:strand:+ start:107 stop:481 length:375 start_codon:yes stop_codon:yes gene_type:complete
MGVFKDKLINFQTNLFLGKRKEGILKELDQASNDPKKELANALSNFGDHYDQLNLDIAKLCEKNPNHPSCVGVESYETVLKRQKKLKNPKKWYYYNSWLVIVFIFFPIFGVYGAIMRLKNKNSD